MAIYGTNVVREVTLFLDDKHFMCVIYNNRLGTNTAGYGWTKNGGKSFFIYKIFGGHIEKLGTLKREELPDLTTVPVVV